MNSQALVNLLAEMSWPKVLAAGIIAAGLYYATMYDDGSAFLQKIENSKTDVLVGKKSVEQTKKAIADADKFEFEVKAIEQQFQKIHDLMPDNLGPSLLTEIITREATQAGAVVTRLEPAGDLTAKSNSDFYETAKINFTLEGSYTQLETFLSNISKVQKILTFEKIDLTQSGGETDRPKLTMTGALTGYRYKAPPKPEGADPNAPPGSASAAGGAPSAKP